VRDVLVRALVVVHLSLLAFPLLFMASFAEVHLGEQRLDHPDPATAQRWQQYVPWMRGDLPGFIERAKARIPEDASILLWATDIETAGQSARWHLFLNEALFPRKVFIHEPALASGTMADYEEWVELYAKVQVDLMTGHRWLIHFPVLPEFIDNPALPHGRTAHIHDREALDDAGWEADPCPLLQ